MSELTREGDLQKQRLFLEVRETNYVLNRRAFGRIFGETHVNQVGEVPRIVARYVFVFSVQYFFDELYLVLGQEWVL